MDSFRQHFWNYLTFGIAAALPFIGIITACHAITNKRDPRSAVGWAGLILFSPGIGVLTYWVFGVNRVRKRARRKFESLRALQGLSITEAKITSPPFTPQLVQLSQLTRTTVAQPLCYGNHIDVLQNGDEAYPEMLAAIANAKEYILIASYIFARDEVGTQFVKALASATKRQVKVRLLIDDIGARYSFPAIFHLVKQHHDILWAKFNRSFWPWNFHFAQLRNHRKVCVVDGKLAFIGGMNISQQNLLQSNTLKQGVQDLHFKIQGPTITDIQSVFAKDWYHSTRENILDFLKPYEKVDTYNSVAVRVIPDGPDEDLDKLRWTILGAISVAQKSIMIVTPYFIPDDSMISVLSIAASKGIAVEIILPEKNNHPFVHWASIPSLRQLMEKGCRIYYSPLPFDHSKLIVVDKLWVLLGSANLDPRSLRLNFELNIECYSPQFAHTMATIFLKKLQESRRIEIKDVTQLSYIKRLRNGFARLFSPYL